MRFTLPPKRIRAEALALLRDYYQEQDEADFAAAWLLLCRYFGVKPPRVRWRNQIDRGHTLGLTHEDNTVDLIRPERFAQYPPPYNTEDQWCAVVLHELFHVVHFVDEEQKADRFAAKMMEA